MSYTEGRFIDVLEALQVISARVCTPLSLEHPGQLAWSSIYPGREAPAIMLGEDAYGVLEASGSLAIGGSADRAREVIEWARARSGDFTVMVLGDRAADRLAGLGGVVAAAAPWFIQQTLDLATVTVPRIPGYHFRHVERAEAAARAACHRAAWSDGKPSPMTGQMYQWLMEAPYYDPALDWVAVTDRGQEMAASCIAWRCQDVALVEPVGCAPQHRRQGLGGGVTLAALAAARAQGATVGVVRPRGDDGYPISARVYRSIGFTDRLRTHAIRFTKHPRPHQ